MEIMRVIDELVCTRRVAGLQRCALRVLKSPQGAISVATDPVGALVGNWVFVSAGSAARLAMKDATTLTDLTICGIIDSWEEDG
jgi:ethanolamine utilization protein EutN